MELTGTPGSFSLILDQSTEQENVHEPQSFILPGQTAIHPELSCPSMLRAGGLQRFWVDFAEPQGKNSLSTWVTHQNQHPPPPAPPKFWQSSAWRTCLCLPQGTPSHSSLGKRCSRVEPSAVSTSLAAGKQQLETPQKNTLGSRFSLLEHRCLPASCTWMTRSLNTKSPNPSAQEFLNSCFTNSKQTLLTDSEAFACDQL